jgi:hypothetical protein
MVSFECPDLVARVGSKCDRDRRVSGTTAIGRTDRAVPEIRLCRMVRTRPFPPPNLAPLHLWQEATLLSSTVPAILRRIRA